MIEVELPDGSIAEFPDGTAPELMKSAIAKRFPPISPERRQAEAEVAGETGILDRFQRFSDLVADPFHLSDEIRGGGGFLRGLVTSGGSLDEAGKAYTEASEKAKAERRAASQANNPTIAGYQIPAWEIAGGFATTGPGQAAAAIPGWLQGAKQSAKVGAGYGGVAGFTSGEGGTVERGVSAVKGALGGALIAPALSHVVAPVVGRSVGAARDAYRYASGALRSARNPEQAAIDNVADRMLDAGLDPAAVRAQISPPPSANLAGRNFTPADMADIISRARAGESHATIAANYGLTPQTVGRYVRIYQENNPTPLNLIDLAKEAAGDGGASPMSRLGRSAYSLSGDESGAAAQNLLGRQEMQSGRVADIITQSDTQGRQFEDEIQRLLGVAKKEERQAYTTAHVNNNPVLIDNVIKAARAKAQGRAGEIGEKLNQAVDLFYKPEIVEPPQSPAGWLRITEARERLQSAIARGRPPHEIDRLRRRAVIAQKQDEFARPLKPRKLGQTIQDVRGFVDARQSLDHMIQMSYHEHKPTPLTQVLTEFRNELNNAARSNNPALAGADQRFYGNRTAERLLEEGGKLARSLNPRSREAMRDFAGMLPEQQELFRVAFERSMADAALNVRNNGGAANQFGTAAFRELVEAFYPKGAGNQIFARGQTLLKNLNREAITTRTARDVLSGSRTAELASDMSRMTEGAQAAADLATGRWGNLVKNLSTRLTTQMGRQGAAETMRILTETDPAKLLPLLNRLEQAAAGTANRRQLVTAARQLRALRSPAAVGPAAGIAGNEMGR